MNRKKKYWFACTAIAISLTSMGCESLTSGTNASKKKKKDSSWTFFKKKEYQIPQSMNVTWTHDILTLPGKPATRGFGGRFYFYNEKTQAIPVDGELVVYGFDDTFKAKGTEDLNQADKRFKFTAEQFTTHFTEGDLGASYSVWIPWDEAYGNQKKIMLIPTFLTKDERLIRGAAASLNLPGKSNDPNEGMVQQTSAIMPNPPQSQSNFAQGASGMRTTTIQVPPHSLRRQNDSPELMAALAAVQNQQQLQQAGAGAMQQAFHPSNVSGPNTGSPDGVAANHAFMNGNTQLNGNGQPNLVSQNPFDGLSQQSIMPVIRYNNTNGLGTPEYVPGTTLSGQPVHSAPNQLQAPALQAAQPSSYPTR